MAIENPQLVTTVALLRTSLRRFPHFASQPLMHASGTWSSRIDRAHLQHRAV